jgi:hypothetical protein
MGSKKRTILMSEDKSRENWQPSLGKRVARFLRQKSKRSGFGVKAKLSPTDSIKVGASKGAPTPGPRSSTAAKPTTGSRRSRRSKNFGVKYTHKY